MLNPPSFTITLFLLLCGLMYGMSGCGSDQSLIGQLITSSTESVQGAADSTKATTTTALSAQKDVLHQPTLCPQGEYQQTFTFTGGAANNLAQAGAKQISTKMLIITDQSSNMQAPLQQFKNGIKPIIAKLAELSQLSVIVLSNEDLVRFKDLNHTQLHQTSGEDMLSESNGALTRALNYLTSPKGQQRFPLTSAGTLKYIVVISNDRPQSGSVSPFVNHVQQAANLKFIAFTDVFFNKNQEHIYPHLGNYNNIAEQLGGKTYDTINFSNYIRQQSGAGPLTAWSTSLQDFEHEITQDIVSSTPKLFQLKCPATSVDAVKLNQDLLAPGDYQLSQGSVLSILAPLQPNDTITITYQSQPAENKNNG